MELLKEMLELHEASEARRAWNGNLKNIDALMSWMYEKDILTATDKKAKDTVFYQYYRYYNDGDMPAALKRKGYNRFMGKERVEKALEEYLEEFIKKMLSKYLPKVDRTEFRLDRAIKSLSTVQGVAKDDDAHGLLTYWLKTVKINDEAGELAKLVSSLDGVYKKLRSIVDAADKSKSNTVVSYARTVMKKDKTWTADMEREYAEMSELCQKIGNFIGNVIAGFEKLKKLHAI